MLSVKDIMECADWLCKYLILYRTRYITSDTEEEVTLDKFMHFESC